MTKIFIRIFPLIFFIFSCTHVQKLDGNYFSKQQDAFSFNEERCFMGNLENGVLECTKAKQNNRNIRLRFKSGHLFPGQDSIRRYDFFKFRFIYKGEDSFIVSPANKVSKKYFNNRDSVTFKPWYAFLDKNITLEKIIYHQGQCGWFCHDLHLEIDNSGNMKKTDNGNGVTDTVKNKCYRGKLTAEELERLKRLLYYSQLDILRWKDRQVSDVPMITLIVYHNNKRLYLKSRATPIVSWNLVNFLSKQLYHQSFSRVSEIFEYEQ